MIDHRQLGSEMDLFHFDDAAPGCVFWHTRGMKVWLQIESYMRSILQRAGYTEVKTPVLLKHDLFEKSGHMTHYKPNMFQCGDFDKPEQNWLLKPMNCPGHVQIFKHGVKSYRDLPVRISEFGHCHRNEVSGSLLGLFRLRSFIQDDGHIFCTPAQVGAEVGSFIAMVNRVYKECGFDTIGVALSTRPEKRMGEEAAWDAAELALSEAAKNAGIELKIQPGEGAFYGPKIEFSVVDSLNRSWQLGTLQVDFNLPQVLEASYIDEEGKKQTPVMLHRAVFGSMERFIGILLEHHNGYLPMKFSPEIFRVLPVSDKFEAYATRINSKLHGRPAPIPDAWKEGTLGSRIKAAKIARVSKILVVGSKEEAAETIAMDGRDVKLDEIFSEVYHDKVR